MCLLYPAACVCFTRAKQLFFIPVVHNGFIRAGPQRFHRFLHQHVFSVLRLFAFVILLQNFFCLLCKQCHLDSRATQHIAAAPAEQPLPGQQVRIGFRRKGFPIQMRCNGIQVKSPGGSITVHICRDYVMVSHKNHRRRRHCCQRRIFIFRCCYIILRCFAIMLFIIRSITLYQRPYGIPAQRVARYGEQPAPFRIRLKV